MAATGDVVIVTTVETFAPYGSIQEYAVKLFENHGRGIGEKGKDNGLLMLLAVKDRQVWIEVGYGLEGFITDGFSGETSRQYMIPYFRQGRVRRGPEGWRPARHRAHRAGPERLAGRRARAVRAAVRATDTERPAHTIRPVCLHRHHPDQRPDQRIRQRRPAETRALGRRRLERLVGRRRRLRRGRRQLGRRLRRGRWWRRLRWIWRRTERRRGRRRKLVRGW